MYMKYLASTILLFSLLVIGCSDQSYVAEKEKPESGKLSDDNVFKGYETALDKANGVEQTIMDSAEQRKKELEEQGY